MSYFGRRRFQHRAKAVVEAPEPLESQIAGEIIQALRQISCHVSSTQQTRASRQTEGMPDLWFSHAAWGVSGWIECKTESGKLSKAQKAWHETNRAAGVHVLVCRSAADAVRQVGALPRNRGRDSVYGS